PSWEVAPRDFQRAIEVTFLGQVWGTMAALARMRPRNRGAIVNVGSALAFVGIPLQAAYCSSKFACRGYFESVRAELLHERSRVRLSMVHLPAVNTPQFDWCATAMSHHPQPVPPIYQPEVPARFIVEAALDGRRTKVVGSWNKMLVLMGRAFPGLGNQFAAIGAWDSQLTDQPIAPGRPVNLYKPADDQQDHHAHGGFDDQAGGFMDPTFLRSLPKTLGKFALAVARTAREKEVVGRARVEAHLERRSPTTAAQDGRRGGATSGRGLGEALLLTVGPGYARHRSSRRQRHAARTG
ncbi:MAG: SDR family oxidoreductase, partial [Candidatus Dormibacteria bacterium]